MGWRLLAVASCNSAQPSASRRLLPKADPAAPALQGVIGLSSAGLLPGDKRTKSQARRSDRPTDYLAPRWNGRRRWRQPSPLRHIWTSVAIKTDRVRSQEDGSDVADRSDRITSEPDQAVSRLKVSGRLGADLARSAAYHLCTTRARRSAIGRRSRAKVGTIRSILS